MRMQGSAHHGRSLENARSEAAGYRRPSEMQREAQEGACQIRARTPHAASVRMHEAAQGQSDGDSALALMAPGGNVVTDAQRDGLGRRRTPQKWRPEDWEAETR